MSLLNVAELFTVRSIAMSYVLAVTSISTNVVFDEFLTVMSLLNVDALFTVISRSIANVVLATSIANTFVADEFAILNVLSPANVVLPSTFIVLLIVTPPAIVVSPEDASMLNTFVVPLLKVISTSNVAPDEETSKLPVLIDVSEPDDKRASTRASV